MSKDYYDGILGDDKLEPEEVGIVHVGKVDIVKVKDNSTRRTNYPFDEDIDYLPEQDEDWSDHDE